MSNNISSTVPVRQSRRASIRHTLIVAEQVVIYTLIVGAIGFYIGSQHQAQAQASFQQAVRAAVATPTPGK